MDMIFRACYYISSVPRYILCVKSHGGFPIFQTETKRRSTIKQIYKSLVSRNDQGKYTYGIKRFNHNDSTFELLILDYSCSTGLF